MTLCFIEMYKLRNIILSHVYIAPFFVTCKNCKSLLKDFKSYIFFSVRPYSKNDRRNITQNSNEVDVETKESTRKTEEKLDGRYKESHERKKPK